jgi:glycosyltransferase involved in cell wall biosynthesis
MIDDCSREETVEYLKSLPDKDPRFKIILKHASLPKGCQASRNLGITNATSDWIMFLDSDDLLSSVCLQDRINAIQPLPAADIFIGNQAIFHESNGLSHWVNIPKKSCDELDRFLELANPIDVPWVNGGCLIRRESILNTGIIWSPGIHWDDVWFHTRCLIAGMKVAWLPRTQTPDSWYRVHGTDHYGATLHSEEGYINSIDMLINLRNDLHRNDLLTAERLEQISKVIFNYALIRLIDSNRYQVTQMILNKCHNNQLLAIPRWTNLRFYIKLRQLSRFSPKLTFYVNQIARKRLLPFAFQVSDTTYDSIPTNSPEPRDLNP